MVPMGELGENPSGDKANVAADDYGKRHMRAIIDIGLLDIDPKFLIPVDEEIVEVIGASSDMLVVEIKDKAKEHKVGDILRFKLKYMGALSILNSQYIEKIIE